jgi:hypothetical protein
VPRVTVYHLTVPGRLPLIEEQGLRTRADLSGLYGPPGPEDAAAPGTYAHGRRVSAYLSIEQARGRVGEHGAGLVSWTVDPGKSIAVPASARTGEAWRYWEAARPLREWLEEGDPPEDLEVHQNVPVRAKHTTIHAALLDDQDLGPYAPVVAAVADADRLSAKALMHVAIVASGGDFTSPEFLAAVALAWRDEPDLDDLLGELVELDPDKVASAALAEFGGQAPEAAAKLRQALDETRAWADQQGLEHGQGLFARSAGVLEGLAGPGV